MCLFTAKKCEMKSIILVLFSLLLLCGCNPYNVKNFSSHQPLREKLLPLQVEKKIHRYLGFVPYKLRNKDASEIITKEFLENIFINKQNICYGTLKCNVINTGTNATFWALTFPSILTLGTMNILGFPSAAITSGVELDFEIYSLNKKLITSYTSKADATAFSAFYYGYYYGAVGAGAENGDYQDTYKAAHAMAICKAIDKFKGFLNENVSVINSKLKTDSIKIEQIVNSEYQDEEKVIEDKQILEDGIKQFESTKSFQTICKNYKIGETTLDHFEKDVKSCGIQLLKFDNRLLIDGTYRVEETVGTTYFGRICTVIFSGTSSENLILNSIKIY